MWDEVRAQINRKVGKKGNDTRKQVGSQGSRKQPRLLFSHRGREEEAQGPCVGISSGFKDGNLGSSSFLPSSSPEGDKYWFNLE